MLIEGGVMSSRPRVCCTVFGPSVKLQVTLYWLPLTKLGPAATVPATLPAQLSLATGAAGNPGAVAAAMSLPGAGGAGGVTSAKVTVVFAADEGLRLASRATKLTLSGVP